MKKISKILMMLILVTFSSQLFAQQNVVDYVFKVRYKKEIPFVGTIWLTTTVDSGNFNEGQPYIVPQFNMPGDIAALQEAYNAITGSVFLLEDGSIDEDIFLELTLDGLDADNGLYVPVFDDSLFLNLTINVYVNDSLVQGHYFFNEGKYLWFKVPKSAEFINFVNVILGFPLDDLGFAYIEPDGFEAYGLQTFNNADSVMFRAMHLSKFGGGRGHISSTTGIGYEKIEGVPADYELAQNYPNPFNPSTTIKYSLPKAGNVQLKVYNILGAEVASLISEHQEAGNYEVTFDAENLSSGIYLYTLRVNNKVITKKMTLIK